MPLVQPGAAHWFRRLNRQVALVGFVLLAIVPRFVAQTFTRSVAHVARQIFGGLPIRMRPRRFVETFLVGR